MERVLMKIAGRSSMLVYDGGLKWEEFKTVCAY